MDDWYIPSLDDLKKIYENIGSKGLSNAAEYFWSSSQEGGSDSTLFYILRFSDANFTSEYYRLSSHAVRLVRFYEVQ